MKKLYQLILMAVMAICMAVPGFTNTAEAANIVLLPVINNATYEGVEETFYDNAIDCIHDQGEYNLIDGDAVETAIKKYTVAGQIPNEQVLRNIAEATDADLVACVVLKELEVRSLYGLKEDADIVTVVGNTISYNRENNKFKNHKFDIEERYDPAMYFRQNYPLRKWARTVKHEMNTLMNVKKFKVEKPRFQKF